MTSQSTSSAFSPVPQNTKRGSVSSEDSDVKTAIHFPEKAEGAFNPPPFIPWWSAVEAEAHMAKPPMWSWWGLQNQRLSSFYRFGSFTNTSDDEKPSQSYIGLIAEAILSSPEEKLILSDIYGFILGNYPYFRNKGTGWRNSIRHNLSLNDCFIKAGRSQNGKGHFWAINPLYLDDFRRGDFRRKRTYKRPSRGKKARAKLEAMMRKKEESLLYRESMDAMTASAKTPPTCNGARDDFTTLHRETKATEQTNMTKSFEFVKNRDGLMEAEHACGEPQDIKKVSHLHREREVPSSPDWIQDEYQEVDVCKTDYEEDSLKPQTSTNPNTESENRDNQKETEDTNNKRSFDMERLLAPERNPGDFRIIREMYPMHYNIMSYGMRNGEPAEGYGGGPALCSHCCSAMGSYPDARGMYPMPAFGKSWRYDECKY